MITIRSVSMEDIPQIQSIAHETWPFTYADIYSEEFIHTFLSKAYSTESLNRTVERDLLSSQRNFLLAEYHDEVVGYAHTIQVNEEEVELLRIYVRPAYHQRGIGRAFLHHYMQMLKPMKKLFAWVAKENDKGILFYEKSGFKAVDDMHEIIEGQDKIQIKYELEISN